jgi:hypothetical protein
VALRFDMKTDVTVVGRHSDLSGGGEFREIRTPRAEIAPGYWDFNAAGPSGTYVASIEGGSRGRRRSWRPERPNE